ncbi:prephenate/arogenate dehydrogenase family protein [Beijerinckia sp. L45]|uniref:prephenate/arogenate dehydrogenase family protein n=1 Tax=Beijerinckia sp. L45 TaxID=1641855 RepID=UPI00131C2E20|nr:prephenate/arogenate dehydrogenase family protein [Beijerinckia sp. L45]
MADKLGPPLKTPLFDTITVIGLGLIGASIIRVARQQNLARRVIGADADPAVRVRAREIMLGDQIADDLEAAVRHADLVMLCIPVGAMGPVGAEIGPILKPGAIISDVGSVKASVIAAVAPHMPAHVHLIPGHPVAGTEYSGPDAGFASLFVNRWSILTPPEGTDDAAIARLTQFWTEAGANVEVMSASHHDIVLAITSHVPHLIAYNIVRTAADLEAVTQSEVMKFSAGGFRDFTRIASSDPTMWRDIFLNNREAVLEVLGRFNEDLSALQRMVRVGDGDGLFDLFARTRAIRRGIIAQGQETAAPDFGRRAAEAKV